MPALEVAIGNPVGVAVDAAGNRYVAAPDLNRVLKLDAAGTITTVAGNGTPGFSGDNGPATAASLCSPSGVALDAAGNLYIADQGNKRIRRVDPRRHDHDGGGQRRMRILGRRRAGDRGEPDQSHRRRGRCGGQPLHRGSEQPSHPPGRSLPGTITTVAGNGDAGFSGDNGPATAASLNSPIGVALDAAGNLYIADRRQSPHPPGRSRRHDHHGGGQWHGWVLRRRRAGDRGEPEPIRAASRSMRRAISTSLITDNQPHPPGRLPAARSRRWRAPARWLLRRRRSGDSGEPGLPAASRSTQPATSTSRIEATSASAGSMPPGRSRRWRAMARRVLRRQRSGDRGKPLTVPTASRVDAAGNLYIADQDNHRIRRVDPAGTITTVAGNGTPGSRGDGGPATAASLASPAGVALDAAGNLYIADSGNHRIRRVDAGRHDHHGGGQRHRRVLGRQRSGDGGAASAIRPASRSTRRATSTSRISGNQRIRRVDAARHDHDGGGQRHARASPATAVRRLRRA